jgi:glyoxalase family protein
MTGRILGIHHITAIADDPRRNISFYTGVLGSRLVKLNFDDPGKDDVKAARNWLGGLAS